MSQSNATAGLIVVVLVVSGCLGGPAATQTPEPTQPTTAETTEPTTAGTAQSATAGTAQSATAGTAQRTTTGPSFGYQITTVESVNETARDVTVALTSENGTVESVRVTTRVYAGNTTDDDAEVWRGTQRLGTIEANDTVTFTQRVVLSLNEALRVRSEDGWITIVATIRTVGGQRTITTRRNVG